jgi:5-formyltetrahydrofolate cyclo-ligase
VVEAVVDEDAATAARKAALRRATRAARGELGPDRRALASGSASGRLAALPEVRAAEDVLLYAASGTELDVGELATTLRTRGVRTYLPRVRGDDLEVVEVTGDDVLGSGFRRILEPVGPAADVGSLDVLIVPGLAFDPTGGRLGQGGGHYDRFLAGAPEAAVRVGAGFACQVVPRVPRAAHDLPVDLVVTERATYRTRARWG